MHTESQTAFTFHVGLLLYIVITMASGAGSTDEARQMGSDTSVQRARCKTADSPDLGSTVYLLVQQPKSVPLQTKKVSRKPMIPPRSRIRLRKWITCSSVSPALLEPILLMLTRWGVGCVAGCWVMLAEVSSHWSYLFLFSFLFFWGGGESGASLFNKKAGWWREVGGDGGKKRRCGRDAGGVAAQMEIWGLIWWLHVSTVFVLFTLTK